jgi:hypothetical protein
MYAGMSHPSIGNEGVSGTGLPGRTDAREGKNGQGRGDLTAVALKILAALAFWLIGRWLIGRRLGCDLLVAALHVFNQLRVPFLVVGEELRELGLGACEEANLAHADFAAFFV